MMICCQRRWTFFALIFGAFFITSNVFSQIVIQTVDPGPYTPGSTIATTFTVGNSSCMATNNRFEVYLSDANGNFGAEKLIGTYTGFYTTYINGIIPAATVAGTGYKLRVKSTSPTLVSAESAAFEIRAGTAVEAKITSEYLTPSNTETFGTCISKPDNTFYLQNESTPTSSVTATITDEGAGGAATNATFNSSVYTLIARQTHYTIFSKAVMPNGTVATKAYLLINNKAITAFGTSGNNLVCLPLGQLEFNVDFTSSTGIQNNFPGDLYTITWGDGETSVYTLCDIIRNGGKVTHAYQTSSCGRTSTTSSGSVFNSFAVSINVGNNFCGTIGTPVSSYAKVVVKPVNRFSFNTPGCTATDITFTNNSLLGENPNSNTSSCTPNNVTYNWFVDGVAVEVNKPRSFNLVYKFATRGEHTIRLESRSSGACDADPVEMKICIQDPPKPAFSLSTTTICVGSILAPTDLSVIDNICDGGNTYLWNVPAGVTFVNGTNASSKQPQLKFAAPGTYAISLSITTPSCGVVTTPQQTVVVNDVPTAMLSPDILLCNLTTYDFNPTTTGPSRTTLTGTTVLTATTYTWTVTGGSYSFVGGTNANSQYPSIKFDDYAAYTITVTHINNCGTATDTQKMTFSTAPVINAGPDQSICYNDSGFQLAGAITGTVNSQTWVGGLGTFTPSRNDLNAVYTPTAAEKANGIVTLQLRATTSLSAPCNEINDDVILTIKENISITSAPGKTICTGTSVNYTPTSAAADVTFNWTATGTANASGYSASGTGAINDVITNSDANANATVTYTITPEKDGCTGTPFILQIVVNPNPTVVASAPNLTICNSTSTAITLTSPISGVNFSYTSEVTGAITGNTNRATANNTASINDILTNAGTTVGTVTYTITPSSVASCMGVPTTITISVLPSPTLANAGPNESICNTTSYTLKGNTPVVGTGKWTIVSAPSTVTFADDTQANTIISGLETGNTYVLRWTISDANCTTTSDDVEITVNPLSVGGTTAGDVTVCSDANGGNISLSGQTGSIVRWEQSIDNGITWATITSTANPFVFTNLTTTTQFRAIVQSGACAEAISSVTTVTVNPETVVANAGADQSLCSGNGITLTGNNPSPNTGLWTLTSGQADVVITDPTLFNTTVTGLTPGQVYKFRWTISGFAGCPPSSSETTITYYNPISNNISASSAPVCAGQPITITGDTPTGGTGSFVYQWQSSADGNTWVNVSSGTGKDLTFNATLSAYYRRLVNSTICTSISNSVQINVLPAITNNTISADQQICSGGTAATLVGSSPNGGNGTFLYQWQSSADGTSWNDVPDATAKDFSPANPAATIFYRRLVVSGPCSSSPSNTVKLTVNPPAKAEITFTQDTGCVPFVITSSNVKATVYADRNASYTWFANDVQIGTGPTFPGYTIASENQNVEIKLVVTSSLGCSGDETTHTFATRADVVASFTQNTQQGCGPLAVTFTNTSSSLTAGTFKWDFGNGTTSNLAQPPTVTFQGDLTGKDVTYNVTLEATTPCGTTVQTSTVVVKASPVSVFSPSRTAGCSPFAVDFSNTSPETDATTYTYDFGDGSMPLSVTDRRSVSHTYSVIAVQDFTVTMTAQNACGSSTSSYVITVSPNDITPELVVNSSQLRGCTPFKVDFYNNTKGAKAFIYDFGDGNTARTNSAPETVSHTFTKAGKYTVTLYASNDCSNALTTEEIEVLAQPIVSFTSDKTSGCDGVLVKFKNTSTNAIAYVWDFGDGTTSNDFEPTHAFTGVGNNYTVTLTATNALGCTNVASQSNYISVVSPPVATFTVSPGNEISIPDYTFGFRDTSVGAVSWEWTFGDGTVSTLKTPNHTYAENGTYTVTLKVLNKEGCSSTSTQIVRIIGVPGSLSVPNSFMPASAKNELRTFKAKGKGIKEWTMSVFNKWGQLLWETSQLDDGAPLEGWDGTYKGQDQPQGVYYWKIDVKFINGSEWKGMTYDSSPPKKTGVIYLIR
ncbi:PKD domain-containing protein [Pedobacter endophyticus]|nr:PKD domain-containing protein [Pedobacter endophyticus]